MDLTWNVYNFNVDGFTDKIQNNDELRAYSHVRSMIDDEFDTPRNKEMEREKEKTASENANWSVSP